MNPIFLQFMYLIYPNENWIQTQILTQGDTEDNDDSWLNFFGVSLAISENIIVIGNTKNECVYVYELSADGSWNYTKKLTSDSSINDDFGANIAIDGSTIVVGHIERTVIWELFIFLIYLGVYGLNQKD